MTLTKLREREEGFTLIELLVVIIIIGILAAIAIPTFLRQRERGWEATAQSDLKNAAIAQESFATENNGDYTDQVGDLTTEGFQQSSTTMTFAIRNNATEYCMTAVHTSGGDSFRLDSTVGTVERGVAC